MMEMNVCLLAEVQTEIDRCHISIKFAYEDTLRTQAFVHYIECLNQLVSAETSENEFFFSKWDAHIDRADSMDYSSYRKVRTGFKHSQIM
jgi:hypothetical protein